MNIYPFFRSNSPFSNWYMMDFEAHSLDGFEETYNCMEQYMMHSKALLFLDHTTAEKIMASSFPKTQKELGRSVKNFNDEVWLSKARNIVRAGLRRKFDPKYGLRDLLLLTQGVMVEASPWDTIWGCGLSHDNPDIKYMSKWRGLNWLGFLLTDLREEIKDAN